MADDQVLECGDGAALGEPNAEVKASPKGTADRKMFDFVHALSRSLFSLSLNLRVKAVRQKINYKNKEQLNVHQFSVFFHSAQWLQIFFSF